MGSTARQFFADMADAGLNPAQNLTDGNPPIVDPKSQRRAIFIEVQPTKRTDWTRGVRPFHHARVVVTRIGQHQNGEPLDENSKGRVYDREDGKVIGTSQCDKTLEQKAGQEYDGLPQEWTSIYGGFTTLSDEEIQKLANTLVAQQKFNNVEYNVFKNNCLDFAVLLSGHLRDPQSTILPTSVSERRKKRSDRNDMVVDPDPAHEWRQTIEKRRDGNLLENLNEMLNDIASQSKRYRTIAQAIDDVMGTSFSVFKDDMTGRSPGEVEDTFAREMKNKIMAVPDEEYAMKYGLWDKMTPDQRMERFKIVEARRATSQPKHKGSLIYKSTADPPRPHWAQPPKERAIKKPLLNDQVSGQIRTFFNQLGDNFRSTLGDDWVPETVSPIEEVSSPISTYEFGTEHDLHVSHDVQESSPNISDDSYEHELCLPSESEVTVGQCDSDGTYSTVAPDPFRDEDFLKPFL